jgi:hypothetical protein
MGVHVHEAGRHDPPAGIDSAPRLFVQLPDRHDAAVPDSNVRTAARSPCAIDDLTAYDCDIEHGVPPSMLASPKVTFTRYPSDPNKLSSLSEEV